MNHKEKFTILSKIIAHAWKDPEYKKKLKARPAEAFKEAGMKIPSETKITVLENTKQNFYFVIPEKPDDEMTEELMASGGIASVCGGDPL